MPTFRLLAASLLFSAGFATAQTSAAIASDPAVDRLNPPSMQSFQIPSHGFGLNAIMYIASGAGPHPVVVLLHGFPGNEKNLDLAQAIRRAGWNVMYFDYRGSWGTPGDFSFTHSMEDAQAALIFLRNPAYAGRLHADPNHIVLAGHSMGGMIAAYTAAHDPAVDGAILISAADMAGRLRGLSFLTGDARTTALARAAFALKAEGMAPLAGCSPEGLALDLAQHADEYGLAAQAAKLAPRPILVVTSDDGNESAAASLVSALATAGDKDVTAVHITTDHSYSGKRIELEQAVLAELDHLAKK